MAAPLFQPATTPPQYNGIKLRRTHPTYGSEPLPGETIQELEHIANGGSFAQGNGSLRQADVSDAYVQSVARHLRLPAGRRPRVVVDGGNGVAGPLAVRTLEAVGAEVIPPLYRTRWSLSQPSP